ncbi:hypothetical protein PG999_010818 [Apiospora kogelbergensis]|uniref:Heterokaryon incompatibility domain-containing protein n=1 Tax=Apiospora kogelbergensis TaxID=1337665 RepID=A0AAW0QMD9_9PEZI
MVKPYDPLPAGPYIRLLELHHRCDDGFHGTFTAVSLDVESTPPYTAISYTWDKPVTHAATLQMSNGRSLPLSQTVADLFSMFCGSHSQENSRVGAGSNTDNRYSFYFWIDALCVDQNNRTERASQVAQMGRVYSSAEQVLVWLGQGTSETRAAFAFMESKKDLARTEDWSYGPKVGPDIDLILPLLTLPWFRRTWVIQEVALNERVILVCGNDAVDFEIFRRSVNAVWKSGESEQDELQMEGLWNATQLFQIRGLYLDEGSVCYELLLQAAFYFETTDARDAVFAFQGIADSGSLPVPPPLYTVEVGQEPAYSESVDELYRRTAEALLCHGTSLDLLSLGGLSRERAPGLPTWVPDYRHLDFVAPFMSCNAAGWDTGGELKVQPRLVAPDWLQIQARPLDTVESVCAPFDSSSVAGQQRAMTDIESLGKMLPKELRKGSWRKDLAMHLIFGLDIDDQQAGPEFRDYYIEWKEWLNASTSDADLESIGQNKFHRAVGPRIDDWVAFGTKQDRFCIGPPQVEAGDVLYVVPGCRMPLVLRPKSGGDGDGQFPDMPKQHWLVSWCYVSDMMNITERDRGDVCQPAIDIVLC